MCHTRARHSVCQLLLFDFSFQHKFTQALANFTWAQAHAGMPGCGYATGWNPGEGGIYDKVIAHVGEI